MGSGMYNNVGFRMVAENGMEPYAKLVMDCLFPEPGLCGVETILLDGFLSCDWSRNNGKVDPEELFQLMNTLFGATYVYTEEGQYTTVADYYQREEHIYDPVAMVERYAYSVEDYNDCFGMDWEEFRERLQEENLYEPLTAAMLDAGFELDDDYDCIDELMENYDEDPIGIVDDLDCEPGGEHWELVQQLANLLTECGCVEDGNVDERRETPLTMEAPSQETMDCLIQAVLEKGHTELVALILEKTKKE